MTASPTPALDAGAAHEPVRRFTRLSLIWIATITLSAAVGITYLAGTAMIARDLQFYGQLITHYVDDQVSANTFDRAQAAGNPHLHAVFHPLQHIAQVETIKVLAHDGTILWSDDANLIGQREPPSAAFQAALAGEAQSQHWRDAHAPVGSQRDSVFLPLLLQGFYIPVHGGTTEVLGVVEVYRRPVLLLRELQAGLFILWGLLLTAGVAYFLLSRRLVAKAAAAVVETQARLARSRRFATVGECVGFIVHDTRNLLAAVRMACVQVERGGLSLEQQRGLAASVHLPLEMSYAMMNDLLDYVRGRRPQLEATPLDLAELLERGRPLLEAQLEHGGHRLNLRISAGLVVSGDAQKLLHVFINLVRNSAEAMPAAGEVDIEARATATGVQVTIRDSGPGIAPDKLVTLFADAEHGPDSLRQGLGLAIVQDLVVRHGGAVRVRNHPQGGAEFALSLPLATAVASVAAGESVQAQ